MKKISLFSFLFLMITSLFADGSEPNPPTWPDHVKVFQPGDASAQGTIDHIFSENGGHQPPFNGQWSNDRYALLFMPGTHNLNVNVGYYTSVIGLGKTPKDTTIGTVTCENGDYYYKGGALSNFWRSAENFHTVPTKKWNNQNTPSMMWAVSQAAPLRRVVVEGDLSLYEYNSGQYAGYASGGFMADCSVSGTVYSGSQQQWISRNTDFGGWNGGVWNMVFVGCHGAPATHCGNVGGTPDTTIANTPVIAEKPYIIFDAGRYFLVLPSVTTDGSGSSSNWDEGQHIDFNNVYVATESDSASVINAKLKAGLHLVLTPGNYQLEDSIQITNPNTCVLGIGLPTLIAENGNTCITVGNVDGVRIAGILLQAGTKNSSVLLQWGQQGYQGNPSNPGFLYDCYARVGGANDQSKEQVYADIMVQINSGHVVCDNLWLWRADHGVGGKVYNSDNPCKTGFQVNGENVTAYGLAVEHTLQNLTEWNGENGAVYFYQSEYPYDVTEDNYGKPGYVSYKVKDGITNHSAWAVGVYSFFRDHDVTVNSGIETPTGSGIHFVDALSVFLDGQGQITHVINNTGTTVKAIGDVAYVCDFLSPSEHGLHDFAHQMTDHFEDGFQWKDVISMIRDSRYHFQDHFVQTPEDTRESIKTILDHVIDITDTPYLPDALTDPLFKGMVHPFVDMMAPLTTQPPLMEIPGKPDHDALIAHTHILSPEYEGGFYSNDLGHIVEYSLNVADSYTEATVAEKSSFAKELINCVIDETNTVYLPDYFVDWIFKSISSSMVDHHFESRGIGTSPGGTDRIGTSPAQDLDSAEKVLNSLEKLFHEKNYDAMTAEAWNLRAAAQGYQADRNYDPQGNALQIWMALPHP